MLQAPPDAVGPVARGSPRRRRPIRIKRVVRVGREATGSPSDGPLGTGSSPFDHLERTPGNHFDLYFYAAVVWLHETLPDVGEAPQLAFLNAYFDRLPDWARGGSDGRPGHALWWEAIEAWEIGGSGPLPLQSLRSDVGVDHAGLTLLFVASLADEDGRFASLFRALQPGQGHRPSVALLSSLAQDPLQRDVPRTAVGQLLRLGLLEPISTVGPRGDWQLQPSPVVWDALRGGDGANPVAWATFRPLTDSPPLASLIVSAEAQRRLESIPRLLASGAARAVIIRGPGASGRRTALAGLGRLLGRGTLEVTLDQLDDERAHQLGLLASALHALPIIRVDPGPGEIRDVPRLGGFTGPIGLTLPRHGGARGPDLERSVTLTLGMPDGAERVRHWAASLALDEIEDIDAIGDRYRLSGGNIRRAAPIARAAAELDGRRAITGGDVLDAGRLLRSRSLEVLATWLPVTGTWDDLVVGDAVLAELRHVEARCRAREQLALVLPSVIGLRSAGVRVLFTGPSGTGKTLAAKVLASVLRMDLYVVELSTVVDKFLGETEKNLTAVFARAAELDAVLLIDEGDALLTGRTDVRTSNDRYANLQTNHLLQLLEAHDGIVVVTTNAGDRIDGAFQRRMDATVEFRMPEPTERWRLWQRHLGAGHDVDDGTLSEISSRCALTGGQVRNAVLHAWLLAQAENPTDPCMNGRHIDAAVRREYRKVGASCPLPPARGAG